MRILIYAIVTILLASAAPAQERAGKPARRGRTAGTATYTGCVDQKGDTFVLTGDKELHTVAILHGDGFSDDNFAKHVGHKVTIDGALAGDADPKVIRVKKIATVSESCSPE